MELLERKFYKNIDGKDSEVENVEDCDYMITKTLMTKVEIDKTYPLRAKTN